MAGRRHESELPDRERNEDEPAAKLEGRRAGKRAYGRPELVELGDVGDLTRGIGVPMAGPAGPWGTGNARRAR